MSRKFNLIVDSCCDLPAELLNREGVAVLNFTYNLDDEDHVDDFFASISAHDFYESMRFGAAPHTSQVVPLVIRQLLESYVDSELPTLFLCFSSGLSGTFDGALTVAEQLVKEHPGADIRVMDTKLASIAEGNAVLEAVALQEQGATIDQMEAWMRSVWERHVCLFMVDDLEALSRGGRIPSTVASIGSVLDVKPMLSIAPDGTLSMAGVSRGRKKGIKTILNIFLKNLTEEERQGARVIVGHADCPDDAQKLKELVCKSAPEEHVLVSNIGPVIGSHVGPGMLALSILKPAAKMKVL